jgi:cyclopropane fatty-acyl-phospholipid synthase-like methyltransferase
MGIYNDLDWDSFVETAPPLLCEIFEKEEDFLKTLSGNVLEIGCGTGRGLIVLAEKCNRIVGIDKEHVMVDASKKKIKNSKMLKYINRKLLL